VKGAGGISSNVGVFCGGKRKMALTDIRVRTAKAKASAYRLSDGQGLYLLVSPRGGKLWRWKYRFHGKEKLMSFGSYPAISIADARKARDDGRKVLTAGIDPMAEKKAKRIKCTAPAVVNPFKDVALQWFEKWKADKDEAYVGYTERRLNDDILSRIGDRPIDDVQAPEIVSMVCAIEARGASDVARRALQTTNQVFRFGIAHGLTRQNPASMFQPGDVLKKVRTENFSRLDKSEFPSLLRKIEGYSGSPVTRLSLKLMALVFLRTSEMIQGEWSEIKFSEARWEIPSERMKGGRRPHIVPLSKQAIAVLKELRNFRKNDRWLFPGERDNDCMSNNTILKALERMGFKGKMTGHGFRGVASTLLHEQGYPHEHIELQLAHTPEDDVSAAYNYAKYLEQRGKMMQDWADFLDQLREI
jgi:integrase